MRRKIDSRVQQRLRSPSMMKQLQALYIFLVGLITSTAAQVSQGSRVKYNFNSDWRVFVGDPANAQSSSFDDSAWKNVTTPYAWNEDSAFKVTIADLPTGVAWYRKHFKVPESSAGNKIFLEFEGIRQGGQFYLNGASIGIHENGVMAFGFDVTSGIVQGGVNVVAARIDNSYDYKEKSTGTGFEWNSKTFYANYGGINKNVYLHVTDKLHQTLALYSNLQTTGVYVYPLNIDIPGQIANITAEAQVRNEYSTSKTFTYQVIIEDMNKTIVKTFNGSSSYTLAANETAVVSASAMVSGINFWSWGYGYLYNVYTTLSVDGNVVDTLTTRTGFRKTDFSNGLFKLNNRALHLKGYAQRTTNEWVALGCSVPPWMSDFSNKLVLDSHGSLIRWMHVTPWRQDSESLDRLGILQSMPAGDQEGDATGRQWDQRTELMRDAIIYNRNNPSIMFYESGNKGVTEAHMKQMKAIKTTYDPHGGRASGSREELASLVAEYGGEMLYINKGARIPFFAHEYSRDEGLRKYWDNYSPPYHIDGTGAGEGPAYNRNQDSHAVENVDRWYEYYAQRPGLGTRQNAGGCNIIFSDSNTHHRGVENYRRSGEVDAVRLPKDAWYAHQVMWNTWVDVEVIATHLVGHWNYAAGTVKNVFVISSGDQVQLFLNGVSLGLGVQRSRFLFTFANIKYQDGELKAVGSSSSNSSQTATDVRNTTGSAAGIRLTSYTGPTGFRATGGDIAIVEFEVIDSQGNRNPIALNLVDFTLSGEATWRGGIAQGVNNYILSTSLPVENGVNRVMLRSTKNAGLVTLKATSAGLTSASITLTTTPFTSTDGLSTEMPNVNLTSYLGRGPTPGGQPLIVKTVGIPVTSATAGSNSATVGNSYDDFETTSWSSSSSTSAAWIKYNLQQVANVNTVVMKMNSFKSKQYHLKISVDSKVVWTGTTELTLGYITLPFATTSGSTVTIASTSGSLGIIEAEILGPP